MPSHATIGYRRAAALIAILCAGVATSSEATAQRRQSGTIADQFDRQANERVRRKSVPLPVPGLPPSQHVGDRKQLFVLTAVELSGATAIAGSALAATFAKYIGKPVSQADLLLIAEGITALYRERGYALTRAFVPPQDVQKGRIKVTVVEGFIDDVVVNGDPADLYGARSLLDSIKAERPTRLATLERRLLLVSDTPGLRIRDTALQEIGEASGRFRLIVQLESWRIFSHLELDNRGTSDIGHLQGFATTALNSGLVNGDTWVVNVSTIPDSPEELTYLGGLIDLPVRANGVRIGVRASHLAIRPDGERRLTDERIRTEEFGIHASFAPLRTRRASLKVIASLGLRNDHDSDSSGLIYDDRIRAASLITEYQFHDDFNGANYLVISARRGLPILGASEKGDPDLSRSDGTPEFYKLYWGISRYQGLGGPWSALLSTTGQLASSPLLQSEEFFLGGPLFGRAFASGDLSGDSGLTGLLELRFDQKRERGLLEGYQVYAFVDAGIAWNRGGIDTASLSSYGAGLRLFMQDDLKASVELALPISSPEFLDAGTRVFLTLSKSLKSCPRSPCGRWW